MPGAGKGVSASSVQSPRQLPVRADSTLKRNRAMTRVYILYDTDSGALYYDADGSGKGAAIRFAIRFASLASVGTTPLLAADFIVT